MIVPEPTRPHFDPGYGIRTEPDGMLPWSALSEAFAAARSYWIGSTRADGRPHAAPVWGVWLDETLHFSTGPASVKGRNLARRPEVVVHLESGDDVFIIEGRGERVTNRDVLSRFADAYDAKYSFRPNPDDPGGLFCAVRPTAAYAWRERDFPQSATCWRFT
ncbi:MAG TPA: pyridoxamine 5'-phosphate oxidase family protein [Chloroflexota bacterium]|nr:pyridoxamine 5'-phosphate oxidase family protein [Chloroflexota bacterium]